MGTKTLGNTSAGNSQQFWFQDPGSGEVAIFSNDTLTTTEVSYIDKLHFFCSSDGSNAASSTGALYTSGGGTQFGPSATLTVGTTVTYQVATFSTLIQFASGFTFRGAMLVKGGGGGRTWGRGDGGTFTYALNLASLPGVISGTSQSGLGNVPWYVEYFPAATITGFKDAGGNATTQGYVGERLQIDGLSFTAGIASIDFNGVAADLGNLNVFSDTGLNINIPAGALTGPVHVVTNAGTATSSPFTITGGSIERSGVLVSATAVQVFHNGVLVPAVRTQFYHLGSLIDVH